MQFLHILARLFTPRRSFAYRTLEADRDFWRDRCGQLSEKVDGLHRLLLMTNGIRTVEQMDKPPEPATVSSGRASRGEINRKYQDQFARQRAGAVIPQNSADGHTATSNS